MKTNEESGYMPDTTTCQKGGEELSQDDKTEITAELVKLMGEK